METKMKARNLLVGLVLGAAAMCSWAQDKVVYHISDAATQALAGLRNVKNHLDTDPKAQIIVVTHANGVDFLMTDAQDKNGNPYEIAVQELVGRGVKFEVCEITLKNRGLKKEQFIQEAKFTPSGVVRLARLQKQGYAYIKP
ncbi:MAG: DsrE family protein [Gammaproteobacteria bacterium]|nr:DsrE family protein [Gammaproteobacteria bacterium]MBU1441321.1 DsrE family protein [Gammaproteobacteria bacterium]MBU2287853.1 DsrE family protein [Gammaproteobacteria bacterium]MBU2408196.1 DsrE family protein [Gammaproteobacteria bacterium]